MRRVIIDDAWIPDGYIQVSVDITSIEDKKKDVMEVTYKVRFIREDSATIARKRLTDESNN